MTIKKYILAIFGSTLQKVRSDFDQKAFTFGVPTLGVYLPRYRYLLREVRHDFWGRFTQHADSLPDQLPCIFAFLDFFAHYYRWSFVEVLLEQNWFCCIEVRTQPFPAIKNVFGVQFPGGDIDCLNHQFT